jgi:predicted site-specific integrase-resolvase
MGRQESTSPDTIFDQLRQRKTFLTSSEVMAILRINRAPLCRYCRQGLIPHLRMPDLSYRFDPLALEGWLRQRTVG